MKIQPVQIWKDGKTYTAEDLNVYGTYDNFINKATFFYGLSEAIVAEPTTEEPEPSEDGVSTEVKAELPVHAAGAMVASGNIDIDGDDYVSWGDADNVNAEAFAYVAQKLGLTIV